MATGLSKIKKADENVALYDAEATLAPLPTANQTFRLEYANKIPAKELLKPHIDDFFLLEPRHSSTPAQAFDINSLILSDNFFSLHKLLESHAGKISLIYLDPPYCTGFDFHTRDQNHAYTDQLTPIQYIEFMRRRLILLRELLSDDGSIYLHIGHQMVAYLKVIMDEVFGIENFRNLIVRKKCSSKNYTRNQYANLNDYILFYSKTKNYKWNQIGNSPSEDWIEKEYPKIDKKGRYKLVPIHAPGIRNGASGEEWRGMKPPPGKHWQYIPRKLDEFDAAGEIHWSKNNNPRRKVYLSSDKQMPYTDYWEGFRDAHHQSIKITGYPTEKNLQMLELIVRSSSEERDLILDPFCGSGTTLDAATRHNRQWIGLDQSVMGVETTIKRFIEGLKPMGDYINGGTHESNQAIFPDLFKKVEQKAVEFNVYYSSKNSQDDIKRLKLALGF